MAAVSELPEYNLSRKISAARIRGYDIPVQKPKRNGAPKSGIRGADGKKRQKNKKNKNNDKNNKRHIEEVEVLQDGIKGMKHTISELIVKKKGKDGQGDNDGPPKQDAGNAFGGHCEKAKKD